MRIEKIEIRGFGKLTKFKFTFEPGMNVIWGPNEAGKSTLLEFLFRMLYGFAHEDPSGEEARERDRLRPWSGGPFGGCLWLMLGDRRRVRVDRDFDAATVSVTEVTSRESRFGNPEDRGAGAGLDPEELLGMSAPVYRTTAMLLPGRASDVLEHRAVLREALVRAAADQGGNPAVDAAAAGVSEYAEFRIGAPDTRFTPLAQRRARLQSLSAELERIKSKRDGRDRHLREIAGIEDRIGGGRRRGRIGKRLVQLRARAAGALAGERDRAVVEEEMRVCEQDIHDLEESRAAHLLAAQALRDVSREEYRGFAAELEADLRVAIPRVTVGRYRGGTVDPTDLSLRVEAPGAPGPVLAEHFSQGTRIQFFGVLRLAISRFFGRMREPAPILLDEPYAECDPARLAASCGHLLDLAKKHQIVLVTHNRRILALTGVGEAEVRRVAVKDVAGSRSLRAVRRG